MNLDGKEVLVLVCYDLKIFDNLTLSRTKPSSWRGKRIRSARKLAKKKDVNTIIHHAHVTDTAATRRSAMSAAKKQFGVEVISSAGRYCAPRQADDPRMSRVEKCLAGTKHGDVGTVLVTLRPHSKDAKAQDKWKRKV